MKDRGGVTGAWTFTALALLAACGTEPTAPDREIVGISVETFDVVTLEGAETLQLPALLVDSRGTAEGAAPDVVWSSSEPGVATVANGLVTPVAPFGHTWIHARSGAWADSVHVVVQPPESAPSTFDIELFFADDVPEVWRQALLEAEARWEQVVRLALPAVEVASLERYCGYEFADDDPLIQGEEDGLRIQVLVSHDFPPDTYVEAVGGPCMHRGLPSPTTVVGHIILNADKFEDDYEPFRLAYVAHHEMGHTFGLAGIVQGFQPPFIDAESGRYTGHLALWGYRADTGTTVRELDTSNGGHWNAPGVMGVGSGLAESIGSTSVGSLMDLGYPAAWYGAGPYWEF